MRLNEVLRDAIREAAKPETLAEAIVKQRRVVAWLRKVGASDLRDAETCLSELLRLERPK